MLSKTLPLLFVGLVAATPVTTTQPSYPKCSAQKDPVFVAYQLLKLSPLGQKWCKDKIAPVTQTVTVGAVQTALSTNTALSVVTVTGGVGGTITNTAGPITVLTTETATAVTTVSSSNCPATTVVPRKRTTGDCPNAPIIGCACEILEYACHCLNLPTSTIKQTVTSTATTLVVKTTTVASTTAIPTTVFTTPTVINTQTVTSTSTVCSVLPPPVVVPGRPTSNTCNNPTSCDNVNFCPGSDNCVCLTGSDGVSACGNIDLDQGCGAQQPCNVNTDCGATEICITACCDTKICYATDGCPNTALPARMFRKDALVGKRRELPPSFRPQPKASGKA